jgi:hypothetical protein
MLPGHATKSCQLGWSKVSSMPLIIFSREMAEWQQWHETVVLQIGMFTLLLTYFNDTA